MDSFLSLQARISILVVYKYSLCIMVLLLLGLWIAVTRPRECRLLTQSAGRPERCIVRSVALFRGSVSRISSGWWSTTSCTSWFAGEGLSGRWLRPVVGSILVSRVFLRYLMLRLIRKFRMCRNVQPQVISVVAFYFNHERQANSMTNQAKPN